MNAAMAGHDSVLRGTRRRRLRDDLRARGSADAAVRVRRDAGAAGGAAPRREEEREREGPVNSERFIHWIECHPRTMGYIALMTTFNFALNVLQVFHV